MTQLRAQKQTEWNDRVVADLREELLSEKELIKKMIGIEQYKIDLDHIRFQCQAMMVCPVPFLCCPSPSPPLLSLLNLACPLLPNCFFI